MPCGSRGVGTNQRRAWAAVVGIVALAVGCGPGLPTARQTIVTFLEAVQQQDRDRLYCALAGAAGSEDLGSDAAGRRAAFGEWLAERYRAYHEGRDLGWIDPGDDGIVLVKMLALGKGTFFELRDPVREGGNALSVRMDLRFGYSAIALSRLSPGTTFYVCGAPLGRIHALRVPLRGEVEADALDTLSLRWTLVRRDAPVDGCPAGWSVADIEPLEETLTTEQITWVF